MSGDMASAPGIRRQAAGDHSMSRRGGGSEFPATRAVHTTVASMAARTITCGSCGGRARVPDREWDDQRISLEDWWDEHLWSAHASEDRATIVHQIEPNPFFEPPPSAMGWG